MKRYDLDYEGMTEDPEGTYVKYDDLEPRLIDIAPKDGTHIMAYDIMSNGWKLAFFEPFEGQWHGDAPTKLGNPLGVHRLTHWIPMLADPFLHNAESIHPESKP